MASAAPKLSLMAVFGSLEDREETACYLQSSHADWGHPTAMLGASCIGALINRTWLAGMNGNLYYPCQIVRIRAMFLAASFM